MKLLPFSQITSPADVDELNFIEKSYLCKKCNNECLGFGLEDSIQCDLCNCWLHFECTDTPVNDLNKIANSDKPYFCNVKRCEMRNYSYHSIDRESLLHDNFNSLHLTTADSEQMYQPIAFSRMRVSSSTQQVLITRPLLLSLAVILSL